MSQADLNPSSGVDAEVVQYRAPSVAAILGLVLGILSATALLHPLCSVFAVLGLVVSSFALRQIRDAGPALIGRKAALAGLGLSALFGTAAPAEWISTRIILERQAEPVVLEWFGYFRDGRPDLAHQMGLHYLARRPAEKAWDYYRSQPDAGRDLRTYVDDPLARTLLALGKNANVRLFETIGIDHKENIDIINQVYAVTYLDVRSGRDRTFFVRLGAERTVHPPTGEPQWRIVNVTGGVRPPSL